LNVLIGLYMLKEEKTAFVEESSQDEVASFAFGSCHFC